MTDRLTPSQRKFNMAQIKSKNTVPEIIIRKLLYHSGVRGYRVHYSLPGKPDIVFVRKKIAIFIDGCFWHKCPQCFVEPETRKEFWLKKINSNVNRDKRVSHQLKSKGWTVKRIWEHQIYDNPDGILADILETLKQHPTKLNSTV
jgi:DNA mismatch endonuclease (patch repair protein)